MHSQFHLHSHRHARNIIIRQEYLEQVERTFIKRQLIIHYIRMSNQLVDNETPSGLQSNNEEKPSSDPGILSLVGADIKKNYNSIIDTVHNVLYYFYFYDVVNFITSQPLFKILITVALVLIFSPVLLFIMILGIASLSVLVPLSLFYQSFVLMVKIPAKLLMRFMESLANGPR